MPAVSVIVPARNASATIGRALDALSRQQVAGGHEVIVVDDGSDDDTVAVAESAPGDVRVLRRQGGGPAEARNAGVAASSAPALAFCDADCYPDPGWLAAGLGALEHAQLVQGRVLPDPGRPVGPFDRTLWVTGEVGLYETANLFVSREAFDRVGGFEDWLRPRVGKAMAEDVWLGWRIRRSGATTAYEEAALVHHEVFPRGPAGYVSERVRLEHFPEMVARMPELRDSFCFRRWFLNRRSASFDLALAGLLVALVRRSPLPALAAVPFARIAWDRARGYGDRAPMVLAVDVAADGVGLAALVLGSARSRTPLA